MLQEDAQEKRGDAFPASGRRQNHAPASKLCLRHSSRPSDTQCLAVVDEAIAAISVSVIPMLYWISPGLRTSTSSSKEQKELEPEDGVPTPNPPSQDGDDAY